MTYTPPCLKLDVTETLVGTSGSSCSFFFFVCLSRYTDDRLDEGRDVNEEDRKTVDAIQKENFQKMLFF